MASSELNLGKTGDVSAWEAAGTAEAAFEGFLRDRYSRLIGTVMVIVQDRSLAEDIVQESFARAYLSWRKLWPEGNPAGWIHRVAVNLAISWRRRAAREAKALARLGRTTPTEAPAPEAHPELLRAVASLPARQRAAVALHYTLDLSIEDAAAAMRCRPGTVKSLLHEARRRLREELAGE
jgi:RNA polymerase sigma-70 factor (ECF subfamily)